MRVMGDYDTPSVHQPRKLSVAERAQNPRQCPPTLPSLRSRSLETVGDPRVLH